MSLKMPAVTSAGFCDRAERGNDLAQRRERSVSENGGSDRPPSHRPVGEHDARAARDRQHADVRTLRQPAVRDQLGDVDDRLDVVDLDQPRLAERRAIEIACARSCWRYATAPPWRRPPDVALFQISTGLPVSSDLRPTSSRPRASGVPSMTPNTMSRAGIVEKRRQQFRHRDVGLVARRHAVAEADALRLGEIDDGVAEAARLERARYAARVADRSPPTTEPNTAHIRSCSEIRPWQLGPIRRTPAVAATAVKLLLRAWRRPAPVSRKPAVSTIAKPMPASPQSRTACATIAAGTAMIATSHGWPIDWQIGKARQARQSPDSAD